MIKKLLKLELLKEIFNQPTTQKFIAICEEVSKSKTKGTINGVGINFSNNEIESIKLYYGFHQPLTTKEVNQLHIFGKPDTFFELEQMLTLDDYEWHEYYPQGVAFALKIDKNLKVSIGYFMMPKLKNDDLVFQLSDVKNYFKNNINLPFYQRKGIFTLINENGLEHQKDYYYVNDNILKTAIGKKFNVDTAIVPSIEWVLGKGFYSGSSPNDEKIVLQSNYHEVYHKLIKLEENDFIRNFNKQMLANFNAYCVCPGFYNNIKIRSYYYFNGRTTNPFVINTIPEIQSRINSVTFHR